MNNQQNTDTHNPTQRKYYSPPTVENLGFILELTAGGSNGTSEPVNCWETNTCSSDQRS